MLSPRSSNYERLEGGHGPSRTGSPKRFAWKKFAIAAAVLIGIVYLFGPRETKNLPWKSKTTPTDSSTYPYEDDVKADPEPIAVPPKIIEKPKPTELVHPTSFETDHDPARTTHCTSPHSPNDPIVQYALMIDAGSTGSRIHVYKFNNCGPSPEYEYETFKMTQPGLSSYKDDPEEAARSLDVLLDEALRVVPLSLRKCTPVAVKATAGLRLLPGSKSADILHAIEKRLRAQYPFQLAAKDGVVIMDGKDEGVYAWITANYLLGTIKADAPKDMTTHAVLDLGGASTQIVFEPVFTSPDKRLEEGEHKYELKFGGRTHTLYQHSYLGYGLMRARMHVHSLVNFMASIRTPSEKEKKEKIIGNPCLGRGTRRVVEVTDEVTQVTKNVTMDGEEIGSFEACDRIVQLVLAKDSICEMKPCSFNGVYQPSLLDSFPHGKVLLLSYFYDRLSPLIPSGTPLTVSTIASTARDVCLGPTKWRSLPWGKDKELMEELEGRPEWCLDLTFMHALLQLGYEFADKRPVDIGKQIRGTELGWCLGATIEMVGGELTCRD
ncbi:putative guanosine-diphosphatase [Psilocybe cubensis]|uniref:Guanosine-diphosphatase n=2 Tax=Psilocybe cubensis TaxID=181762 RepID=A0ACB8GZM7_PSICU|nr:putative guanosine-diphosphatase [Psilocybe cubensis]KAH9480837.1 putative guanosine-diphosphatase [Psilocybe cubensis]